MSEPGTDDGQRDDGYSDAHLSLTAELEVLREENRRLRDEYVSARRSQYRTTAFALVAIGLAAATASAFFASSRSVLLALGGTGVFLGVLTYYLTPERLVSAAVGREIYDTIARNEAALVSELGLSDERVYVPRGSNLQETRLFVPQVREYDIPEDRALEDILVITDRKHTRGLSLRPTGTALVSDFQRGLDGDLDSRPEPLATQVTDALVEQFELVGSATVETDVDSESVTVAITDSTYGPITQFDHPVASFLAVCFAGGLERPVRLSIERPGEDDRADGLVTCRWDRQTRSANARSTESATR